MNTFNWLNKLISIDTTSRNSNLELISKIEEWFSHHKIKSELIYDLSSKKANILGIIPSYHGDIHNGFILSGHTDVVPIAGQAWDTNPFAAVEIGNKIYGRGTTDMKGFIAVVLALLPEFIKMKCDFPIYYAFSYDEEIGCLGAPSLIKKIEEMHLNPFGCIVGEPTNLRPIISHKGINVFKCNIIGNAAHSSLTTEGCNAIEYAAILVNKIRQLADYFKNEGPHDYCFDVPFSTFSTNMVTGGNAINTIPSQCEFIFEFRNLPELDAQKVLQQIEHYIEKDLLPKMKLEYSEADIILTHIAMAPAFIANEETPFVKILQESHAKKLKVSYGTEAGLFQKAKIPTIICGPGNIEQAHKPNEYILKSELINCENFLKKLMNKKIKSAQ